MGNGPFYEEGSHIGQIVAQGLTKASTGTRQVVLGVKVLGTPDGDAYIPHKRQYERTIYMAVTEKTMPFVVEALQRLRFQGTKFSQLDPATPGHVSMVGQQIDLWCKHEQDQQLQWREKWSVGRGVMERTFEPLDAAESRKLDMLFGKALHAGKPPQVKSKPVHEHHDDPGITDEDIPF